MRALSDEQLGAKTGALLRAAALRAAALRTAAT